MVDIITFEEALQQTDSGGMHLMLGNGFSRAIFPDIFNYQALADNIDSDRIKSLFIDMQTSDFEFVMRRLLESSQVINHYTSGEELMKELQSDIKELKETLIRVISISHPGTPSEISDEQYNSCYNFLSHFASGKKYTFNYDLILYWVLMHFQDIAGKKLKSDDGFRYEEVENPEDQDHTLHWEIGREINQNLYYIHGAMHIFSDGHDVEKLSYTNTGIPLAQQVQVAIEGDKFPVFISEGSMNHKMARINGNAYLARTFSSLKSIGGNLFIFGHSIRDEDDHIFNFLNHTNIKLNKIFIGIFGDKDAPENASIIDKVERWHPKKESREFVFYDSESANVWGK